MAAGTAVQSQGNALKDNQYVLMALAEMVLQIYAAESAVLRALKVQGLDLPLEHKAFTEKAATLAAYTAFIELEQQAKEVLSATSTGDALTTALAGVRKLSRRPNMDMIGLRQSIAKIVIEKGKYPVR